MRTTGIVSFFNYVFLINIRSFPIGLGPGLEHLVSYFVSSVDSPFTYFGKQCLVGYQVLVIPPSKMRVLTKFAHSCGPRV